MPCVPDLHTSIGDRSRVCREGDAALNMKERIAYVRGLIEGSEFHGRDERAQAIWSNLLTVFDSMADSIDSLWKSVEDVEEYLEAIDLDLADLEEVAGENEDDLIDLECSHCGETFSIEEGFLDDVDVEIICPNCGHEALTDVADVAATPAGDDAGPGQ